MKKTLVIISVLAAGMASAIELHGTDFSYHITANTSQNLQYNSTHQVSTNYEVDYISGKPAWSKCDGTSAIQGIYLHDGAGLKLNCDKPITVTYLYIGSDITFKGSADAKTGQINWNNNVDNNKLVMSSSAGAWLDINKNYGSNIDVASMSSGAVYLNTLGALSGSILGTTNTLYATAVFDEAIITANSSLYSVTGDNVTRTLATGDYSAWSNLENLSSKVVLTGVSSYTVSATTSGLSVTYSTASVPEPATATLSLLALAGLAARRRRK